MELVVTKISNADLYKVYTAEANLEDRKFVAMFSAKNEEELTIIINYIIGRPAAIEENAGLKERYFLSTEGDRIGKMNYVDGVELNDVFTAALDYAKSRKEALANEQ